MCGVMFFVCEIYRVHHAQRHIMVNFMCAHGLDTVGLTPSLPLVQRSRPVRCAETRGSGIGVIMALRSGTRTWLRGNGGVGCPPHDWCCGYLQT